MSAKDIRLHLGGRIRNERRSQSRTLRDVATCAGVSLGYLSEVERGTKEPTWGVLLAIVSALGLDLRVDLIAGESD